MGAYLTIDDMCAGFEPAQTQLATIRQRIAALESALSESERLNRALQSDADKLASCDAALHELQARLSTAEAERDALLQAIRDADDALCAMEGVGLTYYMGSQHAKSIDVIDNARKGKE